MHDEQRRHPRVLCVLPVRIIVRGRYQLLETLTKNISLGGLKCLTPAEKPVGTPVSIEIGLGMRQEPLFSQGRIMWMERVPYSEQFYIGVEFDQLSPRNSTLLSVYLEQISQTPHKSPA